MNANEFTGSGTGLHSLTFHIAWLTNMKLLAQTEQGYTINTEWHDCGHACAHMSTHANVHTCLSVQIKFESAGLKQICTPQCKGKQAQIKNTQTHNTYTQSHYTNPSKCHSVACEKRKRVKMLVPSEHPQHVPQRNKQTLLNWCRFGMEWWFIMQNSPVEYWKPNHF